ncbi:MAG: AAA family ATPase [Bacteroidetes bacterium]|nr:AAA family ATPase [Bacteroidota bacterium]
MKRGLVIGRFMPLHKGHMGLIRYAAARCDELIVSLSHRQEDPIPGELRHSWLMECSSSIPNVRTEISLDDFDDETLPMEQRLPVWAAFIRRRFPDIDLIFSSETYGPLLAREMGIMHAGYDFDRVEYPVSGSLIRHQPFRYWDYIVQPARSFFVKKICFYGPESTGKTSMAAKLALRYQTKWVPEVARELITSNEFTLSDIIAIGAAQTERIKAMQNAANKILFCDTDLITTQVYSQHYLGKIPDELIVCEKEIHFDQYFLFSPDVPWVADGLRDLGTKEMRLRMYEVFRSALEVRNLSFIEERGNYDEREEIVTDFVDRLLAD